MTVVAKRAHRIGIEAQCWLLTAYAELDRIGSLSAEEHQQLQGAIKDRHAEGIARAFEAVETSLGDLSGVTRRVARAVRLDELPTLRRLVFEIARR